MRKYITKHRQQQSLILNVRCGKIIADTAAKLYLFITLTKCPNVFMTIYLQQHTLFSVAEIYTILYIYRNWNVFLFFLWFNIIVTPFNIALVISGYNL